MATEKTASKASHVVVVDDPCFDAHVAGLHHPERPERLAAARRGLFNSVPVSARTYLETRAIRDAEAERVHQPAYVAQLWQRLREGTGSLDPDTGFSPGTENAVRLAAGGVTDLCDALLQGPNRAGVALVRPPGHHARPGSAMGFCLLNHVAIGAANLAADRDIRVAILDWDAHHGNGTQEIFYRRSDVLYLSMHQAPPFYPNSGGAEEVGHGPGAGFTVNFPLPSRSGPPMVREVFGRGITPILNAFSPDLVIVSCGLDAHRRDPLTDLGFDDATFGAMASALLETSTPIALVLEGGYDLRALEGSMRSIGHALTGKRIEFAAGDPEPHEGAALERALDVARSFWPSIG